MMKFAKTLASLVAVGALGTVGWADAAPKASTAAIEAYNQDIAAAFSPGYWEGSFDTYDGAGNLLKSAKNPSCIGADDKESVPGEMRGLTEMMDQTSDCTVTAAKPGTLELTMTCKSANGLGATFTSKGSYISGKSFDLWVTFETFGDDKGEKTSFHSTGKRTRSTC